MARCLVEGSAAVVPGGKAGGSLGIRRCVVGVGGEPDAFVKRPESGLLMLDPLENHTDQGLLMLDPLENHTDPGLLMLDPFESRTDPGLLMLDAIENHTDSGLLMLDPFENRTDPRLFGHDVIENHAGSRLLGLDGKQAVFQAIQACNQAILQAVLTDDLDAGEGDAGGDDRNEFRGQGHHAGMVAKAPEPRCRPGTRAGSSSGDRRVRLGPGPCHPSPT